MPVSDALRKVFLGERASDVQLDPRFESAERRRERLAAQAEETAFGTAPTGGQLAAERAGKSAAQQLQAATRASAAGVRGPGALFALNAAQRNLATGSQNIAGETARASAAAGLADRESAQQRLAMTLEAQAQAAERERLLREEQRKKGLLGILGAGAGALIGGGLGGMSGARAGAGVGSGVGRSLEQAFA